MGPSDNFLDMLDGAPQDHGLLEQFEDKLPERYLFFYKTRFDYNYFLKQIFIYFISSVPIDWFVDELLNNPELTKTIVRKFMDTNQVIDSILSLYYYLIDFYLSFISID